jgi:AraC-like DNA-binding protein
MTKVRREGFEGQHLTIVPPPVRAQAVKHPLLRGLLVTDAGYFPRAEGHRVERPQGSSTHLLILCLHGAGWVSSHGRTTAVQTGDIVWLPAHAPHAYGAAEPDPWKILWVHFCGDEVPAWRRELGWPEREPFGTFHFARERLSTLGLEKVYGQLEAGYSTHHLLGASSALRAVFCAALDAVLSPGALRTAEERTAAVRDDIAADPARPFRLEELATAAGLSVPHFSLLFRRQTGYAPIDFVLRQRVRRACRLLDRSHGTIGAIATEVGFADPYYFSRCFRRVMGVPPRAYRQRVKG